MGTGSVRQRSGPSKTCASWRRNDSAVTEPLGKDTDGAPVYLKDVWPTQGEVAAARGAALDPESFARS